jgi:hypothetical protein
MADDRETATIDLSRAEARVVIGALADFELEDDHENAGVAEEVRERIVDAFGEDDLL